MDQTLEMKCGYYPYLYYPLSNYGAFYMKFAYKYKLAKWEEVIGLDSIMIVEEGSCVPCFVGYHHGRDYVKWETNNKVLNCHPYIMIDEDDQERDR